MSNIAKQTGEWYQEIATGLTTLAMTVVFFARLRRFERSAKLKFEIPLHKKQPQSKCFAAVGFHYVQDHSTTTISASTAFLRTLSIPFRQEALAT
jgi:hypothetical protein